MEWMIYPAVLLLIVVVLGVIMARRSAVSRTIAPGERDAFGEIIGAREPGLHQSTTVLPERPVGPGVHY
ncbi:MAG: hypothetical protein LBE25_04720 [Arthrobacter sp.]|jgi:hypothetical protein|nr:hypothetical protein [Arthrobacter sp.]